MRNKRLVPVGKKFIANQLLEVAEGFIDGCEREFHMELYSKGYIMVQLAKRELK